MMFFKEPFRPFFILTSIIATLVPMYFVGILVNGYSFDESLISVNYWHAHEMIFGFTSALLSGFILTAAPKWAKREPIDYKWTLALVFFWLLARIVLITQTSVFALYTIAPLPLVLLIFLIINILRGNGNLKVIVPLLLGLLSVQLLSLYSEINNHYNLLEISYKVAAFIIVSFLIIFSGRLIPFFVNSRIEGLKLVQNKKLDFSIIGIAFLSLLSSLTSFIEMTAALSSLSFILLTIRLYRLFSRQVLSMPLLWILYVGHIWINLFFILNAITLFTSSLDEGRAVLHTLYAGALGTIAIGMMFRVSLGHSGLEMKATTMIKLAFYSMIVGSIARVVHPILMGGLDQTLLHASMGFWTLSFILYLIYFIPKFIRLK